MQFFTAKYLALKFIITKKSVFVNPNPKGTSSEIYGFSESLMPFEFEDKPVSVIQISNKNIPTKCILFMSSLKRQKKATAFKNGVRA